MDGIANIFGGNTVRLTIRGRAFTLSTMVLDEYAEREAYIISRRPAPRVCAELPNEKPPKRRVGRQEDELFQNSPHGLGWRLMRALRKHHPEFNTVDRALSLIAGLTPGELAGVNEKLALSEERDTLPDIYMPGSGRADAADTDTRFPWAKLAKSLCERNGWTPDVIGRLTLYQAFVFAGGKCPEDGAFTVEDHALSDFRAWRERKRLAGL
jgi:hypothetical protein